MAAAATTTKPTTTTKQTSPATNLRSSRSATATCTLNWSSFKPEFSGKPDEDAEVHLLHSNDWMNSHNFINGIKVQRFCLTLLGEARLWYLSLEPINVHWPELQNLFR